MLLCSALKVVSKESFFVTLSKFGDNPSIRLVVSKTTSRMSFQIEDVKLFSGMIMVCPSVKVLSFLPVVYRTFLHLLRVHPLSLANISLVW